MAQLVTGDAAQWLASRRGELNQRFERARRRFPALAPDAVLRNLAEILPPLAGPEVASGDLLSSIFDLVLMHTARESFARPGIDMLLKQVFPKIRMPLLERPAAVPGALSNAVENLGARGATFVKELGPVCALIEHSETLLDAVAVLAWRMGEARLRESALEIAGRLPARVLLLALDLEDWPDATAPLVVEGLRADGWRAPRKLLAPQTVAALAREPEGVVTAVKQKILNATPPPLGNWTLLTTVGDFSGFGGNFDCPPLVLDGGSRHRLFARCGGGDFRIDADIFGWVCRPHPRVDILIRTAREQSLEHRRADSSAEAELLADGTLTIAGESARFPAFARSASYTARPLLLAATHADSHRIRILAPNQGPI